MKKILSFILVFFIFFELISIFFTNLELFIFNEKPKYSYEKKFLHDWIEKDEDGIVWHKKNYKTRHISRCFDVQYETNNIGARDYNDYFKSDEIDSIMLIGDSFAEGPGVKIDKIFAKILEKKINKKVLNFGNSGTEPKTQLIRYLKYNKDYNLIFEALRTIDLNSISNRFDINNHFKRFFEDELFISFLSKNLVRSKDGGFSFKCNLSSLIDNIDNILDQINSNIFYDKKTFFIKGLNSDYITDEGLKKTSALFPNHNLIPVEDGGHWLHHEKQKEFFDICKELLTT